MDGIGGKIKTKLIDTDAERKLGTKGPGLFTYFEGWESLFDDINNKMCNILIEVIDFHRGYFFSFSILHTTISKLFGQRVKQLHYNNNERELQSYKKTKITKPIVSGIRHNPDV